MNRIVLIALATLAFAGCTPPPKGIAPPGNYDLSSDGVTLDPQSPKVGDTIDFSYTVKNLGTSAIPATTYDIEFYVDQKNVAFDRATAQILAGPGNTYFTGPFGYKARQAGQHQYRLVLDPDNRLPETDETNNIITGTITVSK